MSRYLRGGPFLRTGFTILSMKVFGWVGGSGKGAWKNWKLWKTCPLKVELFSLRKVLTAICLFFIIAIWCVLISTCIDHYRLIFPNTCTILYFLVDRFMDGFTKGFEGGWVVSGKCFPWKDCKTRTQKWNTPWHGDIWHFHRKFEESSLDPYGALKAKLHCLGCWHSIFAILVNRFML